MQPESANNWPAARMALALSVACCCKRMRSAQIRAEAMRRSLLRLPGSYGPAYVSSMMAN